MNTKNTIFEQAYLESIKQKDVKSPDPTYIEKTDSPIDDLTKQNTTTIQEDNQNPSTTEQQPEKQIDVTIQNQDGQNQEGVPVKSQVQESQDQNDGWGDEVREQLSYVMDQMDSFVYEVKNCVKGSFTGCKTKQELSNYLIQLANQISEIANQL